MSITLTNTKTGPLVIPGMKKALSALGTLVVLALTAPIIYAARKGYITVTHTSPDATLTATGASQTAFTLPWTWPGDDKCVVIKDGVVLTPTTDYTASGTTFTYGHTDMLNNGTLKIVLLDGITPGASIQPASIPADRLDADTQALIGKVTWGAVANDSSVRRSSRLQLVDADGTALAKAAVLRITCDDGGTISVGTKGTLLAGEGNDVVCETASDGKLDVRVNCSTSATITVVAGLTQGSPVVDCSETVDMTFGS